MDKKISEQMQRLYEAARQLKGVTGKSAVATFLGLQSQHLNNWENGRPISSEGLLTAQERIGCDAVWLRDGKGDMIRGGDSLSAQDIAELVMLYGQCGIAQRQIVLDFAKTQARDSASIAGRRSNKV